MNKCLHHISNEDEKKRVLVLCTGNSCRSQMAEGMLRYLGQGLVEPYSAGVNPTIVNPNAVEVMREIGIDISGQRSKSVTEFLGQRFDYIITVCNHAKQTCPVFPGNAVRLHWDIEDPAEAQGNREDVLRIFRAVRDTIKGYVEGFVKGLK